MGSRLYLIRIRTVPSRTSDSWKGQIAPEQRETTLARTMAFSNLFDMVQRLKIKPQLADLKAELQAEYAMKEEHNSIPHAQITSESHYQPVALVVGMSKSSLCRDDPSQNTAWGAPRGS